MEFLKLIIYTSSSNIVVEDCTYLFWSSLIHLIKNTKMSIILKADSDPIFIMYDIQHIMNNIQTWSISRWLRVLFLGSHEPILVLESNYV